MTSAPTLDELLLLMRMEYQEMPDLKLSLAQARRLWDVPLDLCDAALGVLVTTGFLTRSREGAFLRFREDFAQKPESEVRSSGY
jgi:hypothetical protein